MERAALRLATVGTLLKGGFSPYPTIAGGFVFDSAMDSITDLPPAHRRPVIIVRTDEDVITFNNAIVSGRQCRLLLEISVLTSITDSAGKTITDWPHTDSGLELMLDLLEWQVYIALFGYSEWAMWYRGEVKFGSMIRQSSNPRYAAPDRGAVRLAIRTLEFVMRLAAQDCIPKPLHQFAPPAPDVLPPRLVAVMEYLLAHSQGDFHSAVQKNYDSLKTYGPAPVPRLPALQHVWASFPDLEVEADWKIEQSAYLVPEPVTAGPVVIETPTLT
jgi:hypothetical protein